MASEKTLISLAVIAVVISAVGAVFSLYALNDFKNSWLTGFATSTGTVNLTVEAQAAINFTVNNINFGSGIVDYGQQNATLDTSAGTVTNGNWTAVSQGFVVENIGNRQVLLQLATGKDAATFLGGTSPVYQYNVTNIEANSCNTTGISFNLGEWYDVNTTSPGTPICNYFYHQNSRDTIRIDVKLVVPSDSNVGALGDIFTATATAN